MNPTDTARLAEQLGAARAIPVRNLATGLALHAAANVPTCPACDRPITSNDPDLTHTPGTERVHAQCCTDCNGSE